MYIYPAAHMHYGSHPFVYYLWYYLWIAPHVFQVAVMWVMVRRRLHRQFPLFFIYTVAEVFQAAALVSISARLGFGTTYQQVFAGFLAVSTAARFGVIIEILNHVLKRYPAVDSTGRSFIRLSTVVLLAGAVLLAVVMPQTNSDFLLRATYSLDRSVTILQCGLLIALFIFSRYFSLSWSSLDFGLALGLGVFASVELATSAVWLHLGKFGNTSVNLFSMGVYHCCVLIWLFYVLKPEKISQNVPEQIPNHDLEVWNQELQRLVRL